MTLNALCPWRFDPSVNDDHLKELLTPDLPLFTLLVGGWKNWSSKELEKINYFLSRWIIDQTWTSVNGAGETKFSFGASIAVVELENLWRGRGFMSEESWLWVRSALHLWNSLSFPPCLSNGHLQKRNLHPFTVDGIVLYEAVRGTGTPPSSHWCREGTIWTFMEHIQTNANT